MTNIPVSAATYYSAYAFMLKGLAEDRQPGVVSDFDLAMLVEVTGSLARTHAALDLHRVPSTPYQLTAAIQRAEDVTEGIVDALRERERMQDELARIMVDVAVILQEGQ